MEEPHFTELVNQVVQNSDKLFEELEKLRRENAKLKLQIQSQEEELKGFTNSDKFVNIVSGIETDGEDAERLKARIDQNIQELDKCIALLSDK